jgi:hypothetical protein
MSNIRTVNKRHKRAIVTSHARAKLAEKALLENAKPVKVAV